MEIRRLLQFVGITLMLIVGLSGLAWANEQQEYLTELKTQAEGRAMQGALPMNDLAQIEAYLDAFDEWAQLVNQANHHQLTVEEFTAVSAFKERVRTAQSKLLPILRQAAGTALHERYPDLKIAVRGEDAREIRFTHPKLQNVALTEEMNTQLSTFFTRLRFGQVVFMLDHEDISTLLRFRPPQDSDIVLWDGAYQKYSLFN